MEAYFKWLGKWELLSNNSTIDGKSINEYVKIAKDLNYMQRAMIVKIVNNNCEYFVSGIDIIWKKYLSDLQDKQENAIPYELQDNEKETEITNW